MQTHFEKELLEVYVPYLIPNLAYCTFGKEEHAFYAQQVFTHYPSALVYRVENESDTFSLRRQFEDNSENTESTNFYEQDKVYSIKIYVEKEQELIRIKNSIRLRYQRNPYNILRTYSAEFPNMPIGLRLISIASESLRDNQHEKGALRLITVDFQARLVLSDTDPVTEITDGVRIRINDDELLKLE